ncbi:MAG: nitrile hydratase accessory protein [Alphaproteobacteria bacterium]
MTMTPDLSVLPTIPRDAEGPVFREPWEARAFAMAVSLNARGVFAWSKWAAALSREIAIDGGASDYYTLWLRALERLVQDKGVATATALAETAEAWKHAAEHTPHGQPIELGRGRI